MSSEIVALLVLAGVAVAAVVFTSSSSSWSTLRMRARGRETARGRFPREAVDGLAEAGLLGLTIPVEYGGLGQSMRVACAALDEIAQRCA